MQKIAVHFGAGNIGRGFIGLLLSQADYRVVFVDVAKPLVQELQRQGKYRVEIAGDKLQNMEVSGVDARLSDDPELPQLLASAEVISTAVGATILPHVAKSIAAALLLCTGRQQYIIACENMIRGSSSLKRSVEEELQAAKAQIPDCCYFLDAAVDRVVPLMKQENPLTVRVEEYHEWLVEGSEQIAPELAQIRGLNLVADLTPFLKRKIYTVNTGHASAAWHGFRYGYQSVNEAMADASIRETVLNTMAESSRGLCSEYGLDMSEQKQYYHKVLKRFENPFIIDDVLRVGRQPLRKLGPEERIDGPIKLAQKHKHPVEYLLRAAAAAMLFRNEQDPEACELAQILQSSAPEQFFSQKMQHFSAENLKELTKYYLEYQK